MKEDLVSIITPIYNAEKFLVETIESVKSQTYQNWEMILVDDCSKDSSEEIIKKYALDDKRIKYFKMSTNSGAAKTRNKALEEAKGKYIAFLDADDLWSKEKLTKQISFMKEKKIGFSFSGYTVMSEEGIDIGREIKVPSKISYTDYLKNTIIGCLTVIVDKSIVGDFRMVDIRKNQDMATWLNILKKGFYAYGINENLGRYRLVNGSISNNKVNAAKSVWKTYREVEKMNVLSSSYYFLGYTLNAIKKRV